MMEVLLISVARLHSIAQATHTHFSVFALIVTVIGFSRTMAGVKPLIRVRFRTRVRVRPRVRPRVRVEAFDRGRHLYSGSRNLLNVVHQATFRLGLELGLTLEHGSSDHLAVNHGSGYKGVWFGLPCRGGSPALILCLGRTSFSFMLFQSCKSPPP